VAPPIANPVSVTFVGAGDIAVCNSPGTLATARLLDTIPGVVFTTGDNAYPNGSAANYRDCYAPTWGRHRERTRPSPGNHEYESAGAGPYFEYFGDHAGPPGAGFYSYALGNWTAYSLNSNVSMTSASAQVTWLTGQIAANPSTCTIAYWHHPLFSSGPHGAHTPARDLWRALYDAGVDVVLNGHEHLYERFAPQDPNGRPDSTRGIRQFTVGSGGAALYVPATVAANSQLISSEFGVLKLTLNVNAYVWEFIGVDGRVRDFGNATCH
jgi:acid phosphatase type 7